MRCPRDDGAPFLVLLHRRSGLLLTRLLRRWRGAVTRGVTGSVNWGDLRSFEPVDRHSGFRRGRPVDRFYIEEFLERWRGDVRGTVLETGHAEYSRVFGGQKVTRSEVVHAFSNNPKASIVGDLSDEHLLTPGSFDCILLTQTLQYIPSPSAALRACHAALRPGGVLLVTAPALAPLSAVDRQSTGEFWRFTSDSMTRLLHEVFGAGNCLVEGRGNLVAATAFLHGLAAEELSEEELRRCDADYEMLVLARAVRQSGP